MKKILFAFLAVFIGFSTAFGLDSSKYITLDEKVQIKNADNSVIEIFSYGCIHCYAHHKNGSLATAKKANPNITFAFWQVEKMGQYGEQMMKILAYAAAVDAKNSKDILDKNSATHKVMESYFEATFKYKMAFRDADEFYSLATKIFETFGQKTTAQDIENYALSESGKAYIQRANEGFEVAKITGTPAFVINGKYVLRNEKITSEEDLLNSIKELLAM